MRNETGKTTTMRMILGPALVRALAAEGRTVLASSHLMSEMALTVGHLLVIGKGKLIADSSVDEFVRSARRTGAEAAPSERAERIR
jgi:ABC-2 type transport system ATP-binding protein